MTASSFPLLLVASSLLLLLSSTPSSDAFAPAPVRRAASALNDAAPSSSTLDPVTYLRTEWVSAALCTNQTPRSADKVLQLGSSDGRIVNFVPRTVREIITSSAESKDGPEGGGLTVSCERSMRQMAERRGSGTSVKYSNQPADDLRDTPSSSVDVVVSLQAARRMAENGLDWKRSVEEAGRVLKPGGRFLFVEAAEVAPGEGYLDYVLGLSEMGGIEIKGGLEGAEAAEEREGGSAADEGGDLGEEGAVAMKPVFEEVGYDKVDMVLVPHVAGVAIKALDADLSDAQKAQKRSQEEDDRMAEIAFSAFERGSKRRKRKKKKAGAEDES